tara:strand:+ start:689 stop:1285 length:597 start_codon:yes stop_codon:yes gene_type:complete
MHSKCYAKKGHQALHAKKVTEGSRGYDLNKLLKEIEELRPHTLLRLNVSGDLPSVTYKNDERKISTDALTKLLIATQDAKAKAFTYTHLHSDPKHREYNLAVVKEWSTENFVINVSCESSSEAVKLYFEGQDVALTNTKLFNYAVDQEINHGKKAELTTKDGSVDLFPCPASYKGSNCNECRECSKHHRENIVVFKET